MKIYCLAGGEADMMETMFIHHLVNDHNGCFAIVATVALKTIMWGDIVTNDE